MVKFKDKYLDLIKEVGSVSVDIFQNLFHEYITEHIKNISQDEIDVSLLRWLCNVLENSIDKKYVVDEKINKKEIVLNEYFKLKPNARSHEKLLDKIIEDLHNTGQIKRIKTRTKLYHKIKSALCTST
jgi:hypothetical protein